MTQACYLEKVKKPENFGLEHYPAKWYTYKPSVNYEEEIRETREYFKQLLEELHSFPYTDLSPRQQIAYHQIDDFLTYQNKVLSN